MTLIIAIATEQEIVQVSDERLTGAIKTDLSNKAVMVTLIDGTAAIGFAGLAAIKNQFKTSAWIADCVKDFQDGGSGTFEEFVDYLRRKLCELYSTHKAVRSVRQRDDALYVLISGFDPSGKPRYGHVANRASLGFNDAPLARGTFKSSIGLFTKERPIVMLGATAAVDPANTTRLIRLAAKTKSADALINVSVDTIRAAAERDPTIGRNLTSLRVSSDPAQPITPRYHSEDPVHEVTLPNQTRIVGGGVAAFHDITISSSEPMIPRVPRNAKCPCKSGLKYKACCMKKSALSTDWTFDVQRVK